MKTINKYFVIIFSLYPLWAWLLMAFLDQRVDNVFGMIAFLYALLILDFKLITNRQVNFPKYLGFLFLFYLYTVLVNYATDAIDIGTKGMFLTLLLNEHLTPFFLFFIIENMDVDFKVFRGVRFISILIFIVSIIVIVIQYYVPFFGMDMHFVNNTDYLDFSKRLFSIYSWISPNACGISFPFIVAYLYRNSEKNVSRFSILMGALLYAFFTQTRYIIISTLIILVFLYFKQQKLKLSRLVFFAVIPVAFYFFVSLFSFDFIEFFNRRILEDEHTDFQNSSAGSRIVSLNAFKEIFPVSPFWGNGEAITTPLRKLLGPDLPFIHIGYLQYLYAYGIIGCFFFFGFCYLLLRRSLLIARAVNDYSFFIGLTAMLIANTTLVWFRFFDFGVFVCYMAVLTKYKTAIKPENQILKLQTA